MNQFQENEGILSKEDSNALKKTKVLLVGVGGLGGYIANSLVRLGVHTLVMVDFDTFDVSNLNRQLFSTQKNIGREKVDIVKDELKDVNLFTKIVSLNCRVESLDRDVYNQIDLIIDAVDNIPTKLYIETIASTYKKPLLHGAVGGWYGQYGIILPESNLLHQLYENHAHGLEKTLKSPTFTPGVIANCMVSEFVKYITNKQGVLINQLMMIDLLHNETQRLFNAFK